VRKSGPPRAAKGAAARRARKLPNARSQPPLHFLRTSRREDLNNIFFELLKELIFAGETFHA
jgi:hypothetical protein